MNIGNIFQQKMVSQTNPFGSPKSALNQALGRINNNILQNINLEAAENQNSIFTFQEPTRKKQLSLKNILTMSWNTFS